MSNVFRQTLITMTVCVICLLNSAKADDDIFVNLSVLDGLSAAPQNISAPQGPLFPIVKKAAPIKKRIKAKSKTAPKVKVVQKIKEETPKKIIEDKKPQESTEQPQIPYIESVEKVEVVDVEPILSKQEDIAPENVTDTVSATSNPDTVGNIAPVADVASSQVTEQIPEKNAELLLDENVTVTNSQAVTKLTFLPEVDELTPEQQQQIDAAIASFEDALSNKIAIYAYNLDDGVDTFKRKRLSLNRAVAVRSYLLPKGYKNFSIKVVNVDASSGKTDTVELEEIKR
ncbi:MAG: hypothetical protein IJV97_03345 [Alphaproteobacteria bacterium]|nr:hypothetical protein [Alphaproteobacteria bacterium]